jgi:hypothetical protein
MADQDGGFWGVVGPFLKVGPHAVGQDCGLPDVEQFALLVSEQIDAGLVRQVVEFRLEFSRSSHQLLAFSGQQGESACKAPF